ncbi:hypothetical protein KOI35_03165 [Actinoplanes bogorensis]|uniref:Uncharacterized protein n=1 Tax=Paractinoplanes bogorensis TaxID=1610840 RepID=A0ABS5YGH5_9ACTN|nr:hypothetical protein [Actinoplanes bogorensis]MBU2662501.1 hypothetical protein [Actinoplanes bogorensis]
MSWDVFLFRAPADVAAVDEIAEDFDPDALGPLAEVLRRLGDALPEVDLGDPAWGMLDGSSWHIELNIGKRDPVDSIMLHVRGGGDDVLPVIARIAAAVDARALDISTGEFLTGDPGQTAGWRGFQQYRDR